MKILVATTVYPSTSRPDRGTFVDSLVHELRRGGDDVRVLVAVSMIRYVFERVNSRNRPQDDWVRLVPFLSVSTRAFPWLGAAERLSLRGLKSALTSAISRLGWIPDVVYAQFLSTSWALCESPSLGDTPCVVALGDSGIERYDWLLGEGEIRRVAHWLRGAVSVSGDNASYLRARGGATLPILTAPNAVDGDAFAPRPQAVARRELSLPENDKIVLFCGPFVERKGPCRVLEAINQLQGVKGVFVGQGPQTPSGDNVLFAGPVPHKAVPIWMAAADVFVLPSLAEGMSNAVLEALSCGLPLVLSDRSFNRAFVNEQLGIFVDPERVDSIVSGIRTALESPTGSLEFRKARRSQAQVTSLSERANRIRVFLTDIVAQRRTSQPDLQTKSPN